MINLHESDEAKVGFELVTPVSAGRHVTEHGIYTKYLDTLSHYHTGPKI